MACKGKTALDFAKEQGHTTIVRLLEKTALPAVSTYQAAGVVPARLGKLFAGRVGLFANQPGDKLLEKADCVVTVGFHLAEYDPEVWNAKNDKAIVHIDYRPCDIHTTYVGDINPDPGTGPGSRMKEICVTSGNSNPVAGILSGDQFEFKPGDPHVPLLTFDPESNEVLVKLLNESGTVVYEQYLTYG